MLSSHESTTSPERETRPVARARSPCSVQPEPAQGTDPREPATAGDGPPAIPTKLLRIGGGNHGSDRLAICENQRGSGTNRRVLAAPVREEAVRT